MRQERSRVWFRVYHNQVQWMTDCVQSVELLHIHCLELRGQQQGQPKVIKLQFSKITDDESIFWKKNTFYKSPTTAGPQTPRLRSATSGPMIRSGTQTRAPQPPTTSNRWRYNRVQRGIPKEPEATTTTPGTRHSQRVPPAQTSGWTLEPLTSNRSSVWAYLKDNVARTPTTQHR